MSSSVPQFTALSASSSAVPDPNANGTLTSNSPRNSMLIGFLVAFAMFGVFMASNLIWHRTAARRRLRALQHFANLEVEIERTMIPKICNVSIDGRRDRGRGDWQALQVRRARRYYAGLQKLSCFRFSHCPWRSSASIPPS